MIKSMTRYREILRQQEQDRRNGKINTFLPKIQKSTLPCGACHVEIPQRQLIAIDKITDCINGSIIKEKLHVCGTCHDAILRENQEISLIFSDLIRQGRVTIEL